MNDAKFEEKLTLRSKNDMTNLVNFNYYDDDDKELFLWYGWPMKVLCLISSWDHCQRSSPTQISNTLSAVFEPAQNLSSGFVE